MKFGFAFEVLLTFDSSILDRKMTSAILPASDVNKLLHQIAEWANPVRVWTIE